MNADINGSDTEIDAQIESEVTIGTLRSTINAMGIKADSPRTCAYAAQMVRGQTSSKAGYLFFKDWILESNPDMPEAAINQVWRENVPKPKQAPPPKPASQDAAAFTINTRRGSDIKPEKITWLWPDWLPSGKLTIFAGAAGSGKTTVAITLAATVTNAGTFPDGAPCNTPGNVLIWSGEDNPDDTLAPRMIAANADMSRVYFITGITKDGKKCAFDPAQHIFELYREAERIGGVSLLIVDPIISAVVGDMNQSNNVRRSLEDIVSFANVHKCAVIGISHFSKGSEKKPPQDRIIGSQAFGALPRMAWCCAREEATDRRILAKCKCNIAPDHGGFSFNMKLETIEGEIEVIKIMWEGVLEGSAREILNTVEHDEDTGNDDGSKKLDAERFLQDLLANGAVSVKQIKADADGAGYSWATMRRAKDSLHVEAKKEGFAKTGVWTWQL